ncbi:hypothetical protein GCM10020000_10460 [Streptomyces olivoverticillatus]
MWLQEVGAPAPHIPPGRAAAFTEATVRNVLDCPDVWGVTWWCSHDVDRSLADFPELEYGLGLLTNDRRVKPAGEAMALLVREFRQGGPAVSRAAPDGAGRGCRGRVGGAVPLGVQAGGVRSSRRGCGSPPPGGRPAVVLEQHADDAGHPGCAGHHGGAPGRAGAVAVPFPQPFPS